VRNCKLLTLFAAGSLVLTACQLFGDDKPAIDRWGGLLSELRYQWDAAPGIDVTTGPAVPVRAFIESRMVAQSMGNLDYAYPGFTQAVPADDPGDNAWDIRPNVNHPVSKAPVGTARYHILSLARAAESVTASVCYYRYSVATEVDGGKFESVASGSAAEPKGIDAERVTLAVPKESSSLPAQSGPSPAPTDDVFGNWQITGYLFSTNQPGFQAQWPTYDADVAKCVEKAPDSAERRNFLINGEHPRSDFPTSPPSPGWPEPAK